MTLKNKKMTAKEYLFSKYPNVSPEWFDEAELTQEMIKMMESYASQRIEKYRELIEWLNNECPAVFPPLEPYTTADLSHDFAEILRSKLNDLKTELGL